MPKSKTYYSDTLENEIYPAMVSCIDSILPEFEFVEKRGQWVSTNTLHLSGLNGQHGKGKVTVSKCKIYAIGDHREGTKQIVKYLIESTFHSKVNDFKSAVEYLANKTNISLADVDATKDWGTPKKPKKWQEPKPQVFIPYDCFTGSLKGYDDNNFIVFLISLMGIEKTCTLVKIFNFGSSNYWKGATVFWFINEDDKIVGGDVVLYDENGSSVKFKNSKGKDDRKNRPIYIAIVDAYRKKDKPTPDWLQQYQDADNPKRNCLFGLPQLKNAHKDKPVAIVESPKTAIIATAYLTDYIWLATGGATLLTPNRLQVLEGRDITLFPDKSFYQKWKDTASKLSHLANFVTSDLIERKGGDKTDLADYLTQYSLNDFQH